MGQRYAPAATDRSPPVRFAKLPAMRQRLLTDAENLDGEVSFQSLRGVRSDGDRYEQASAFPEVPEGQRHLLVWTYALVDCIWRRDVAGAGSASAYDGDTPVPLFAQQLKCGGKRVDVR